MFFKIKKMPLNALNLIYCEFHIAQILIIEDIDNIIKGALEVFISVCVSPKRKGLISRNKSMQIKKSSSAYALGGVSGVASFITTIL